MVAPTPLDAGHISIVDVIADATPCDISSAIYQFSVTYLAMKIQSPNMNF